MGSQHAACLMLTALQTGCTDDVRATLANLDRFFPAGSPFAEFERRELIEGLGAEVVAHRKANPACRALLEHLAGTAWMSVTVQ